MKLLQATTLAFCWLLLTVAANAQPKTNVVLVLIDDLGWNDLGCYGSEYYQTPNIDRLADEGMRFTDGYATLRELKLDERTLVIFTSDNDGFAKATDNSPLRANKGSNYEGGIRVPVIIKWPGQTKPGTVSNEPVTRTDFYPTILSVTGQTLRPHQHVDGKNLVPILTGSGELDRDALYWHYPHYNQHPESSPSGVIRAGDWKLIEAFETGALSLFNLTDDISETNDLADKHSAKTAELHDRLKAWRLEVGADPMRRNPEYTGK